MGRRSAAAGVLGLLLLLTGCHTTHASSAAVNSWSPSPGNGAPSQPSAIGKVLSVAVGGDDRNAGTEAEPFATIDRGLRTARAGDTVAVQPGTYAPASFVRGGTADAPVTLLGIGDVELKGDGSGIGITAENVQHVVIEGFHVEGFQVGIALAETSSALVRGNTVTGNDDTGIQNWKVDDVKVAGNRLLDAGVPGSPDAVQDYGVNFYYSSNVEAVDNYFFGRHNQALSFKRRVVDGAAIGNTFEGCLYTCIYVGQNDDDQEGDMTSVRITVKGNRFRAVTQDGVVYTVRTPIAVRNVQFAVVQDNVFDPSCEQTVFFASSPSTSGLSPGQNTVSDNATRRW